VRVSHIMNEGKWVAYLIENSGATYVGVSPTPERRLRQHNGEIVGGARYTTGRGPGWRHVCYVRGFRTSREALQFEWAWKNMFPKKAGGIRNRLEKLERLCSKTNWTSNSPQSSEVPLVICTAEWMWPIDMVVPDHISVKRGLDDVNPTIEYEEQQDAESRSQI